MQDHAQGVTGRTEVRVNVDELKTFTSESKERHAVLLPLRMKERHAVLLPLRMRKKACCFVTSENEGKTCCFVTSEYEGMTCWGMENCDLR